MAVKLPAGRQHFHVACLAAFRPSSNVDRMSESEQQVAEVRPKGKLTDV